MLALLGNATTDAPISDAGREPWMPRELRERPRIDDEDRRRMAAAQAKRERRAAKRREEAR